MPSHGWVNVGLVSLLVRAVSQGMFIGGFGSVQLKAACFGLIFVCLFCFLVWKPALPSPVYAAHYPLDRRCD